MNTHTLSSARVNPWSISQMISVLSKKATVANHFTHPKYIKQPIKLPVIWIPIGCLISSISTLPSTLGSIHTNQAFQAWLGGFALAAPSAYNPLPHMLVLFKSAQKSVSENNLHHGLIIATHLPRIPDLSYTPLPFSLFHSTLLLHSVIHLFPAFLVYSLPGPLAPPLTYNLCKAETSVH